METFKRKEKTKMKQNRDNRQIDKQTNKAEIAIMTTVHTRWQSISLLNNDTVYQLKPTM